MKQTLITGFGPFGEVVNNPTESLLNEFFARTVHNQEITTSLFSTQYAGTSDRLKAVLEVGGRGGAAFDNILLLGVAPAAAKWQVERYGHNIIAGRNDAAGFKPQGSEIMEGQFSRLYAMAEIDDVVARLEEKGLPVAASESAGAYLCNYLYYHALHLALANPHIKRCLFLHIPADPYTMAVGVKPVTTFPVESQIVAVEAVLEAFEDTV